MPKLVEVDLSKGVKANHVDIRVDGTFYLVKINGSYFAGRFRNVWFGLSFGGWYGRPIQFDTPGSNRSLWEGVWEIVEQEGDKDEEYR